MELIIKKPGLLSTVQDMGRLFHLSEAVPVSGPVDMLSPRIANRAVGNDDNAPVIEFTYGGAELVAATELLIAVSGEGALLTAGASFTPSVDLTASTDLTIENDLTDRANSITEVSLINPAGRLELPYDRPLYIPGGTSLSLKTTKTGCRLYMAVAGGWDVPEVMGSKSTYLPAGIGGYGGRVLKAGDRLTSEPELSTVAKNVLGVLQGGRLNYPGWSIARRLFLPDSRRRIRVMQGREFDWFEPESRETFFTAAFRVSTDSNRMGCLLEGNTMKRSRQQELLSTAVAPGTIQVPGNGRPILLMADAQTTGGYPRIAQVAAVDLPVCGQLRPGDAIMFTKITWDEAERLYFAQERQLAEMTAAIAARTYL